ncbi:glycosyltransferase family 1 protein, partial [Halobacillus trueperi]
MVNVFIIGSKGIPAKYGGFETFVDQLTKQSENQNINYHVSCLSDDNKKEFTYNNVRCFNVKTPSIGSSRAVLYDILSLQESINYIEKHMLENCVIYILACRIGPFFTIYKSKLEKLGVKVYVNPDGHEWKRSKWNAAIRRYWKLSERLMVKHSDLLICDSKGIEQYIKEEYKRYHPKTEFIAYGADVIISILKNNDKLFVDWLNKYNIKTDEYYLIVGRFVPENNYRLMIEEFMNSETKKDLVIISNVEENDFYKELLNKTAFDKDKRIKFVGTVYDQQLLKKIREQAYGYLHGHEVGGTNPSLLEALASTKLNLLLDVVFNKEVGGNGAFYFTKDNGSLASRINKLDMLETTEIL